MKRVVIIGAGIGGLSCAHNLSKNKNYDIHVIEREPIVGGLAREINKTNATIDKAHSSYCWKAVSSGYVHFLEILNEITDDNGIKVISNLKPLSNFIYAMDNKNVREMDNSFITRMDLIEEGFKKLYGFSIPSKDKKFLKWFMFRAMTMCEERIEEYYDNITWADYVDKCSYEVKTWILDSTAIYLGMDYKKISVAFMMNLVRHEAYSPLVDNSYVFYSFNGPMNKVFLDVWKTNLEKKGVKFHMESNVMGVNTDKNNIDAVIFDNNEVVNFLKADIVVNASSCSSLAEWYNGTEKKKYIELANRGRQIQTQVLYYLKNPVLKYDRPTVIIMPNTPWFLMTRVENTLWKTPYDLLSTGIGIWDVKGNLFNKTALECTREELALECWNQMQTSQHNLALGTKMPEWDIWYSFVYDKRRNHITTYEPKWSNNVGTLSLRPTAKDKDINNLYHATAYTRTDMSIYNMESAAESGFNAANAIQNINIAMPHKIPLWIRIFRKIDKFFYKYFL